MQFLIANWEFSFYCREKVIETRWVVFDPGYDFEAAYGRDALSDLRQSALDHPRAGGEKSQDRDHSVAIVRSIKSHNLLQYRHNENEFCYSLLGFSWNGRESFSR